MTEQVYLHADLVGLQNGFSVQITKTVKRTNQQINVEHKLVDSGGEQGIRTLGPLARTTVFETAPFDHSGSSPCAKILI